MIKYRLGDYVRYIGPILHRQNEICKIINSTYYSHTVEFSDGSTVTFVQGCDLEQVTEKIDIKEKANEGSVTTRYVHELPDESDTVLDTAKELVYGNRQSDYGHPALDYERVAKIWSGILGVEVTRLQAIQCMIGIKLSRLSNTPHHRDSWVDIAGYAECGDRIRKFELEEGNAS